MREPRPVHFIFHSGHVGSTLLSRLLDETGVVLSLREPLPLRTLAEAHDLLGTVESLLSEAQFASLASSVIGVWSRGYAATRKVIVKATSTASRVACPLLRLAAQSRAVCLNVTARGLSGYLAGRPRIRPLICVGTALSASLCCKNVCRRALGRCTRCRWASWRR